MYLVDYIDYSGNYRHYEVDACNPVEAERLCMEAYQDVDIIINIYNQNEINR